MTYVIQGFYGTRYGWEDVTDASDYEEAESYLFEYNVNEPLVSHRLVQRADRGSGPAPSATPTVYGHLPGS